MVCIWYVQCLLAMTNRRRDHGGPAGQGREVGAPAVAAFVAAAGLAAVVAYVAAANQLIRDASGRAG